jgi:hypothetical protein
MIEMRDMYLIFKIKFMYAPLLSLIIIIKNCPSLFSSLIFLTFNSINSK